MIETRRLKNVVIFIQTILSFVLSRKIINVNNDIAPKYGNVTVKDFRKYEKLEYKKKKLKLDIDFLNNCKQLGVYPKFLIFKLPSVSNKDALSICKRLLHSAINKRNKELQHLSKKLSLTENPLSTQLSTTDFCILTKSITLYNKKLLKKLLHTQQKKYLHWREIATWLYSQLTKLLLITPNLNYLRKNLIYLKQVYTFQSNQIKFENPKSSLLLKRTSKPFPCILRQHRVLRNLRKNKDIVITKPGKGNRVVILDRKFYINTIEEIISDTSKFEKLNEDPTLNREASLERFLRKLKQKTFLMKLNMINCILLVLLLLTSMVLLRCINTPLVIHFLNFVRLFHL